MKTFLKFIGFSLLGLFALVIIAGIFADDAPSTPTDSTATDSTATTTENTAEADLKKAERMESAKKQLAAFKKNFRYSQDEMSGHGWYDHKVWGKGYPPKTTLTCTVFESGRISLSSFYKSDDWLFHESISVKAGDEKIDSGVVQSFEDSNRRDHSGGTVWENVTYSDERENGIIALIANNVDKKILVRFHGDKYYDDITLSKTDKQAIADSYRLANLIKMSKGEDY